MTCIKACFEAFGRDWNASHSTHSGSLADRRPASGGESKLFDGCPTGDYPHPPSAATRPRDIREWPENRDHLLALFPTWSREYDASCRICSPNRPEVVRVEEEKYLSTGVMTDARCLFVTDRSDEQKPRIVRSRYPGRSRNTAPLRGTRARNHLGGSCRSMSNRALCSEQREILKHFPLTRVREPRSSRLWCRFSNDLPADDLLEPTEQANRLTALIRHEDFVDSVSLRAPELARIPNQFLIQTCGGQKINRCSGSHGDDILRITRHRECGVSQGRDDAAVAHALTMSVRPCIRKRAKPFLTPSSFIPRLPDASSRESRVWTQSSATRRAPATCST